MEHTEPATTLAAQALVFLAATCLVIPALRRARLSAVMGFLLIGVAMGPHGLGALAHDRPWLRPFELEDDAPTQLLAELGVVFLLFLIGLEVSWRRLWAMRRFVFGLGLAQVMVTTLIVSAIAMAFGNAFAVALVLGLAFALSSTALVLQLLRERGQATTQVGRTSFSVLLMQDLMVVPILFAIAALSAGPGAFGPNQLATALGASLIALGGIVVVARLVLRPLFRWVASIDNREAFFAAVFLAAIGMALAAQSAGLSAALGAFLAGLMLAETEFRHQIETDLEPFKDLLLGLFFATVGMQIDLNVLIAQPALILVGVLGLFALKAAIIAPLARGFGVPWPRAIETAFLLGQAGEFAFVVIAAASGGGVIPDDVAAYMLLVTALSIFLTPFLAALGRRIAARAEGDTPMAPEAADARDHIVIAGYGRVGQTLADILTAQEIAHVGLDADAGLVALLRKQGRPVHFGDASRRDVLASMGANHAAAIVVTMDRPDAVEHIVAEAKRCWPDVPVYARARDAEHARRLHAAGADLASPDTIEAALQLGEALLNGVGVPDETTRRIIEDRREAELNKALYGERSPG